jgi:hypothetical protein
LKFGPLDVETILVDTVHKREETVSAHGTQDHFDLLLFDLLLSRRPTVDDRLKSIMANQRSRLTRSPVDVEWGRPVTDLGDLGNLKNRLNRLNRGQATEVLRDLESRLHRGQARSLRDLKIRLGRSQGRLRNLKSRLLRDQARCLGKVEDRLTERNARGCGNWAFETAVTGRRTVALGKWDCLKLTTDVTDGAVGSRRASTLAVVRSGIHGSSSVGRDDRRPRASSGPQHGSSTGGDLTSTSVNHGGSRSWASSGPHHGSGSGRDTTSRSITRGRSKSRASSGPRNGSATIGDTARSVSELLAMGLTTEYVVEVIRIGVWDGFRVCD